MEPIEIESTLELEPVGKDWDGIVKPIEQLTYPDDNPTPLIVESPKE